MNGGGIFGAASLGAGDNPEYHALPFLDKLRHFQSLGGAAVPAMAEFQENETVV